MSFLVGGLEHVFPYIGNNNPNWLIFFRGVETTNQSIWVNYVGYTVISYTSIGDYTFIYLMSFLVGGLEHGFYFPNSWDDDMMIQSDELIFFRGVGIPPTSKGL